MSTQPTEAELQAAAAKDQAAKDKPAKDQAAKEAAQPWAPKKGGDCHVMILMGGPRLVKRPAKVKAVRSNGSIDAEVVMPTGEIVLREGVSPAEGSRLGDGYLE